MKQVEVILSPALFHLSEVKGKNVVVIDILRATSTICTALAHGVSSVIPVDNIEEAMKFKEQGYITAGERNGEKVAGFDIGNSPFESMNESLKGSKVALTTTNGTKCVNMSREAGAKTIIIGSFLNAKAVINFLNDKEEDVVLFCAGWKDKVNLEDTLYAGYIANQMLGEKATEIDSTNIAIDVFKASNGDFQQYLLKSSHYHRLSKFHFDEDLKFCLQTDVYNILPFLIENEIKI